MAACLSCIAAPPASQRPRKVYNILVPDLFSGPSTAVDKPLSLYHKRRIHKLQEYVLKNPNKVPKVSRCVHHRAFNQSCCSKLLRGSAAAGRSADCLHLL